LFPLRTRVSTCIYITSTDFFIAQILRSSLIFYPVPQITGAAEMSSSGRGYVRFWREDVL
ncbi:MAG: hypothetical protein JW941_02815, partial [Candidatus Coatesbacteria bacterium]|nr:hypothetical protein [Candidatus Coatesbacteria bacterium]